MRITTQLVTLAASHPQHAVSSFYENDGAMGGNASTMMDEDDSDDEDYKPPPQQARV